MTNTNQQPCINPIEDQRAEALRHYQEVSSQACHWSSFVEAAIKAYNPEPYTPPVEDGKLGGEDTLLSIIHKGIEFAETIKSDSESYKVGAGYGYSCGYQAALKSQPSTPVQAGTNNISQQGEQC